MLQTKYVDSCLNRADYLVTDLKEKSNKTGSEDPAVYHLVNNLCNRIFQDQKQVFYPFFSKKVTILNNLQQTAFVSTYINM